MPVIRIDFDDAKVNDQEIRSLAEAAQQIVSGVTGIEDVFVYANSSQIKLKIAPIEIFVQMSAQKIADVDDLVAKLKSQLSQWKGAHHFTHPINLTFIPMQWKIEIGI